MAAPSLALEFGLRHRFPQLKEVMLKSIITTEPHCGQATGQTGVFAGAFDWHSSVHAHWALHCLARLTDDRNLRYQLLGRLRPGYTEAEIRWLEDNPHWEMPYGQAWWLLLSNELLARPGYMPMPHLQSLHKLVEQRLFNWLEENVHQPDIFYSRQHQSWLMIYFLLAISQSHRRLDDRLRDLYMDYICQAKHSLLQQGVDDADFVDLPSLLPMIDILLTGHAEREVNLEIPEFKAVDWQTCHRAGWHAMHFWPLAMMSHISGGGTKAFFESQLENFFQHSEQWQDDFSVSHWVPQFLWMAIWLSMGRP